MGSIYGYLEFVEAPADPNYERHEEFMEWSGPFAPDESDAKASTKEMRKGLPNWRDMK